MGWKNLPYWMRGGVIGIIIGAVLTIILLFIIVPNFFNKYTTNLNLYEAHGLYFMILLIFWIVFIPSIFLLAIGSLGIPLWSIFSIIFLALFLIYYFVIGAIIGLIIGKIKSKKQK